MIAGPTTRATSTPCCSHRTQSSRRPAPYDLATSASSPSMTPMPNTAIAKNSELLMPETPIAAGPSGPTMIVSTRPMLIQPISARTTGPASLSIGRSSRSTPQCRLEGVSGGPMGRHIRLAFLVAAFAAGTSLAAQSNGARQAWVPARTADGQPDIQSIWTNATLTPFERPASLRDKAFLTEAEAAALEQQASTTRAADTRRAGDVGSYDQVWFDSGDRVVSTRRTSLVIDPPDGRVPLRPEAEAARDYNSAHERDSYEFMSVWDRCITRGAPAGMFPAGYNNAYQIIQTRGYVVIHSEMIHEARIIPLDGAPHPPPNARRWNGDSRGRWDGTTLIVDTTNYNDKGWISTSAAGGRIK